MAEKTAEAAEVIEAWGDGLKSAGAKVHPRYVRSLQILPFKFPYGPTGTQREGRGLASDPTGDR
jgi:hypothetical protein